MKRILALAAILLLPVLSTACNTMEGFGQDMQRGGEKIEDAADRNR